VRTAIRRLVLSESVSNIGWGVSQLAFPLTAVILLDAGVSEVAVLLLISGVTPIVGTSLGRLLSARAGSLRLIMMGNLIRAALLFLTVSAALYQSLSLPMLGVIAAGLGVSGALIRPNVRVYLGWLSGSESRTRVAVRYLTQSQIVTGLAGLALGGAVVSIAGPALALAIDACTYVIAAVVLLGLPRGPLGVSAAKVPSPRALRWAPLPRPLTVLLVIECMAGLGLGVASSAWTVHLTEVLGITPALQGIALAVGGIAGLIGSRFDLQDLESGSFWVLIGVSHFVGALFLIGIAVAADPATGLSVLIGQQLIVTFLASSRDVSSASARLNASPSRERLRVESWFYASPLMAAALGRAAMGIASDLGSERALALATVPPLCAAITAFVLAGKRLLQIRPREAV